MSGRAPSRRVGRALIAVELAAIGTGTAAGFGAYATHSLASLAALAVAGVTAFLILAALAVALTPEA